jgi:predicted NAD-dependent protein-ADP-ribosyltransferase YbiA (DUF1768 family)
MVEKLMREKFANKSWTKPAVQKDDSKATPLAADEFKTFNEFLTFVLIHEIMHDTILQEEDETTGAYEDRINQAALKDLRDSYTEESASENPADYTNHSGGAYGGDTFWDMIGRVFGVTNHKHYKDAGNANLSQKLRNAGVKATILTKEQMDIARNEVERLLGKKYSDTTEGNLQVRNYYQVANSDGVFAVAQLADENGRAIKSYLYPTIKGVTGGTNTAIQLGIKLNKPVYVWDLGLKSWFKWNGKHFEATETPTLTKNFAGVGSRDIESYNVQKDGKWVPREQYKGAEVEAAAKQAIKEVYEKTFKPATQSSTSVQLPGPETKINIYASTGENAELSNFAERPLTINGVTFKTPEGAFQGIKVFFTNAVLLGAPASKKNLNLLEKLKTANGAQAKALGSKIEDLSVGTWNRDSSGIMKNVLIISFEQNPDALAKLLATGNATLTHTQDKGKWGTEFPRLLMEVREEFRGTQQAAPTGIASTGKTETGDDSKTIRPINSSVINPALKQQIDSTIASLKDMRSKGFELAFPKSGFGQWMIGADPKTGELKDDKIVPKAPAAFVYLSQQLWDNFKYANPNFDKALGFTNEPNVLQAEAEVNDLDVLDAISHCFTNII